MGPSQPRQYLHAPLGNVGTYFFCLLFLTTAFIEQIIRLHLCTPSSWQATTLTMKPAAVAAAAPPLRTSWCPHWAARRPVGTRGSRGNRGTKGRTGKQAKSHTINKASVIVLDELAFTVLRWDRREQRDWGTNRRIFERVSSQKIKPFTNYMPRSLYWAVEGV